jgi:hypothetical protein
MSSLRPRPVRQSSVGIAFGWRLPPTWLGTKATPGCTPSPICGSTWPGALNGAWSPSPSSVPMSRCMCGGYRRSAGSGLRRCRVACRWWPASTGPVSSTGSWNTHPPTTSAAPTSHPNHPRSDCRTCSSRHCCRHHASRPTLTTLRWWRCTACSGFGSSRPPALTSRTWARSTDTGSCAWSAREPGSCSYRSHQRSAGRSNAPSTAE